MGVQRHSCACRCWFLSCRPLLAHAAALTVAPIQFVWYVDVSVALAMGGRQGESARQRCSCGPGTSRARRVMSVHHLLFLPLVLFATRRQPFPPPSQAVAVGTLLVLTMLLTARLLSPRSVRLRETGHTYLLNIQQAHHVDHKIDGWLLLHVAVGPPPLVGGAGSRHGAVLARDVPGARPRLPHRFGCGLVRPGPTKNVESFLSTSATAAARAGHPRLGSELPRRALGARAIQGVRLWPGLLRAAEAAASATSRKVGHVLAGCVWVLLYWNLFDASHWTWKLNVLVPVAQTLTFILKGAILRPTRPGRPRPVPDGRTIRALARAALLRIGDGRHGSVLFPHAGRRPHDEAPCASAMASPHSPARTARIATSCSVARKLEGLAACFVGCMVGSAVFLHALGLPAVPLYDSAVLALVATLVEAASPSEVDNLLMLALRVVVALAPGVSAPAAPSPAGSADAADAKYRIPHSLFDHGWSDGVQAPLRLVSVQPAEHSGYRPDYLERTR